MSAKKRKTITAGKRKTGSAGKRKTGSAGKRKTRTAVEDEPIREKLCCWFICYWRVGA